MRAEALAVALLVGCGGAAPAARAPAAPTEAVRPAAPPPFVVARGDLLTATRDQTHLWWITRDAILRRPLGGPDAGAIERIDYAIGDQLVAFAADRGQAYVCTPNEVLRVGLDGAVETVAPISGAADIAVDGDVLYVADAAGILRLAPGRAEERIVDGGAVGALVVVEGTIYYVSDRVVVADADGKTREELFLPAGWISVDDRGMVVRSQVGDVVVRDADGTVTVPSLPDGSWRVAAGAVVAGDDPIYVESSDPAGGAILALPRAGAARVVLATGPTFVQDMAMRRGELFWIAPDRIVRAQPATGETETVAQNPNRADQLELGRSSIFIAGYSGVERIDPDDGTSAPLDGMGRALGVSGDVVAWIYGGAVRVWRKGRRYDLAQLGTDAASTPIAIDDDYLYVAGASIHRIDEAGTIDLVDDGLGGAARLAVVAQGSGLHVLTPDGVYIVADGADPTRIFAAPPGETMSHVFAGGGWIYAVSDRGGVFRIDPGGPDPLVFRMGSWGVIAADADAAYVVVNGAGRIVRLPHDAPALPLVE